MFEDIFCRKKVNGDKLLAFGFEHKTDGWFYETSVMENAFILSVCVSESGKVDTDLVETETNEPYVLYKTNAAGTFIGEIRNAIESVLQRIGAECYEMAVFKSEQALCLIKYVRDTYGDELEFLWKKFPDNAIWRRKDNQKWYGAILTVERNKLGLSTHEIAEIIDLRLPPEQMAELIDNERYFPGWHMNKKHWYTVCLDGSVSTDELYRRLDMSYHLAAKK